MTGKYTFKTLHGQIKAQTGDFWRTSIYGIAATFLLLPVPMLMPLLIDEVLLEHSGKTTEFISSIFDNSEVWLYISVILVVVLALRSLAFFFNNKKTFYATKITQKISYLLRHRILHHLERVSLSEYESLKSGSIASKSVQDVESVSGFAGQIVTTLLSASLMLLGIAVIMLWMNWVLALFVFLLNPFFLAFSRLLGRKTGELLRRQYKAYEMYHELLNETLELFIQVRVSNQERSFFGILQGRAKEIESASIDYGYKASVAQTSSTLLTNTVVDIFRALGIAAVAYSDLTIGMMIAFLFYLSTLVSPMQQLMGLVISYQSIKPALERINTLLTLSHEPHYPHLSNPFESSKTTSVELKEICFAYGNGKEVLHNINLKAKEGEKIALIGPSGSGKTTIAQIMVGFYPSHAGEILYGGTPIEQIGLPVVRENVALMLQEALFFNDTIRMNLTLSKDKSDTEIYEALKAAQLEEFVSKLENGLETHIGKNGIRLSGGQRQRLAIARLILSDPKIVIFDEATSALDNETEYYLYETLESFLKDRTTIIIAHRTTTIKQADHIYLIDDGYVKAEGSYEELSEKGYIIECVDAAKNTTIY
ncbi:ABC transporter ATP-binding protein/permease [Sulfurovum sp. XGS-02]|uniref:ABC transporter ATP-binding protein n=1 Tax=Sulfurovum sp. XGS-02 TaxID=2925411 RepID=UPI00206C29B3|nr:ABC transporter ATP-binding protein [Sulfurovum sp. XGS-02]UPT77279.1 ABC transporter ATP-binding protein/permease [Sulfurovum sp. XGS-02]